MPAAGVAIANWHHRFFFDNFGNIGNIAETLQNFLDLSVKGCQNWSNKRK
jgi:hypothetical protein